MASSKQNHGCTPFEDVTNTIGASSVSDVSGSTTSNADPPLTDSRERKRQRERDRYAQKKYEILKKRREARQQKKFATTLNVENHQTDTSPNCQEGSRQSALPELEQAVTQTKNCTHQVAQLTTKIKYLSTTLHKKDKYSRKGLQEMVQRRKKYLKYLRRTDWASYSLVLSKLGLRDVPEFKPPDYKSKSSSNKTKTKRKSKRKMKA